MQNTCKFIFIILFLKIVSGAYAQVVYMSINSDIYNFLERQSLKNIITLHEEVKPYSRVEIASLLNKTIARRNELTQIDRKQLEWFEEEYSYELGIASKKRWRLYNYQDSLMQFKVSPIAGYSVSMIGDDNGHERWWGASIYGTYSNWFGASFTFSDQSEYGNTIDPTKSLSSKTGFFINNAEPGRIDYSDFRGSLNLNWDWGYVSILKDYFLWGHGKFGQLIFSNKPASYPQIKLELKPLEWLRFYYFHAWLNSYVLDSLNFYYNNLNSKKPYLRQKYINKYVVANLLSVTPFQEFDFSVGNSFVYSGDLRPEMFIPFNYFKGMDHNTGRGAVDDGNGQIFFDIALRYPKNQLFYSTLFFDVINIRPLLKGEFNKTWFGFTVGLKRVDMLVDNLDVTIEYTRINPWVYEHKDETTTYKHLNYPLGYWIGQNADHLKVQVDYLLMRGLKLEVFVEQLRKGGLKDIYYAYEDITNLPFLYEPLRKDFVIGFNSQFEIIHELNVFVNYQYSKISDEDQQRTLPFLIGDKNTFYISVYYGL